LVELWLNLIITTDRTLDYRRSKPIKSAGLVAHC